MKETRFIAQNKEKWLESETLLNAPVKDPEKLSTLFTQVIDDLSYSRTYYPNRSVRVYLNKIAREYFSIIYSHHKEKKNHFKTFWLDELPQIVLYSRKQLLTSLFVFLLSAAIGIFSSIEDPEFTSTILGESYVEMTKANIENGDPMAVYKKSHQVDMVLGITLNNLKVAFYTYVFGIFLSIGSLAILLYNGIMIGCFQYFFIERGLFAESALSIWLHGTLEISAIILAGGAGLVLGSGLLFPGTYSRLQAFQLSAIRSLKLMLGITPIITLAAIIESFLTRYTDVPDVVRLLIIILSAFFIVGYFVVYPWLKSKKGFDHPLEEIRLAPTTNEPVNFNRIKNSAEIIKDVFHFYRRMSGTLLLWIFVITLCMTAVHFFLTDQDSSIRHLLWWQYFFNDLFFALQVPSPVFILINTLGTSVLIYRVLKLLDREAKNEPIKTFDFKSWIQTMIIISIIYVGLYTLEEWGTLLLIFSFGLFLLYVFTQLTEKSNFINSLYKTWKLSTANMNQIMGLQFILLLLSFSFLLILSAPLIYMYTTVFQWNFAKTDLWARDIFNFIEIFIKLFAFNLLIPILASSAGYLYFTLREIATADQLKKSIAQVGSKLTKLKKR
jgi:uncharacterized membrane protein SpoIIM required for sporulation